MKYGPGVAVAGMVIGMLLKLLGSFVAAIAGVTSTRRCPLRLPQYTSTGIWSNAAPETSTRDPGGPDATFSLKLVKTSQARAIAGEASPAQRIPMPIPTVRRTFISPLPVVTR